MISRLALLTFVAVSGFAQDPGVLVENNVMVPMRDGVRLATDIYRLRDAKGKLPVVLYRSPYNKNGLRREGFYFAKHGYVVLAQDCRGRFGSEGSFTGLSGEGADGYDAIEWAAAQPWSDGRVLTAGASYLAWVQYNAAILRPPHLTAMFALVGGSNYFRSSYPGGVKSLNGSTWLLLSAQTSPQAEKQPTLRDSLGEILKNVEPWLALPADRRGETLRPFPDQYRMFEQYAAHPTFDEFWKQPGLWPAGHYSDMKDVPMLFLSGWYDPFVEGVIENFNGLSRVQKSMKKLIVGPWPHDTGRAVCGDADFGTDGAVDQQGLALEWFDHWTRGTPFRMVPEEPVRVFRMGGGTGERTRAGLIAPGGKWRNLPAWPPGAKATKLYLTSTALQMEPPPAGAKPGVFVYDPVSPVPTRGGRYGKECVQNQAGVEKRSDVLSFQTTPLEAALDVTGRVIAKLWVASDQAESDVVARLIDVYPNGYALILGEGQLRSTYREGSEKRVPAEPGKAYELAIDLGPVSNLFGQGHRIRLDVTGSSFPRLEPLPAKATSSVYHEAQRASYLELPVIGR
jgi:putative CocE/NonD family hydrolase